jgi:hypothetical protein
LVIHLLDQKQWLVQVFEGVEPARFLLVPLRINVGLLVRVLVLWVLVMLLVIVLMVMLLRVRIARVRILVLVGSRHGDDEKDGFFA